MVQSAFKGTGKKIFVSRVTMTNLSSLLTELLSSELGDWLSLVALYSAH